MLYNSVRRRLVIQSIEKIKGITILQIEEFQGCDGAVEPYVSHPVLQVHAELKWFMSQSKNRSCFSHSLIRLHP